MVQHGRATYESPIASSHVLSPLLPTLEDFMGMGGEAGKTGSSESQIFLNIFCLTPGLRVLNLKPRM